MRQLGQRHHGQLVHAVDGMAVLAHALRQLRDQGGVRHPLHVAFDPVSGDALNLGHDVQLAASFGQQHIDVPVQLERWAELRFLPPHALGDRAHLAVVAGQEREDAIRFPVVELAQDDGAVTIRGQFLPPGMRAWCHCCAPTRRAVVLRR